MNLEMGLFFYEIQAKYPIIAMPRKLKNKDTIANSLESSFVKPIMARPSSSGKGDAMISPPIKTINHLSSGCRRNL